MKRHDISPLYFLGIGGIGMSALARFFLAQKRPVSGYDLTPSPLTRELKELGADITYSDDINAIPEGVVAANDALIVVTPAIPKNHPQLLFFKERGYLIKKRAEVLAEIISNYKSIAIAGTHGKTTTSAMVAHILKTAGKPVTAFVGGIMSGYNSNVIIHDNPEWIVVEADEFDRSFLQLYPDLLGITSIDPDHLDIYKNATDLRDAFLQLISQSSASHPVLIADGVKSIQSSKIKHYGTEADSSIQITETGYQDGFQFITVIGLISESVTFELNMPGLHNAKNAVLAGALSLQAGCNISDIKRALRSFQGVKRRFETVVKTKEHVFIDDYAHHPKEIDALIQAVRRLFPQGKITGVFQPHLFSRTRDFMDAFATSLSHLDQLFLMDIYPAREVPLPGITSEKLLEKVRLNEKSIVDKQKLLLLLKQDIPEILLTIGAGDIGLLVPDIKQVFTSLND